MTLDTESITHTLPEVVPFTRIIDRSQDPLGRSTGFQVLNGATFESGAKYDYNANNARPARALIPMIYDLLFLVFGRWFFVGEHLPVCPQSFF